MWGHVEGVVTVSKESNQGLSDAQATHTTATSVAGCRASHSRLRADSERW